MKRRISDESFNKMALELSSARDSVKEVAAALEFRKQTVPGQAPRAWRLPLFRYHILTNNSYARRYATPCTISPDRQVAA